MAPFVMQFLCTSLNILDETVVGEGHVGSVGPLAFRHVWRGLSSRRVIFVANWLSGTLDSIDIFSLLALVWFFLCELLSIGGERRSINRFIAVKFSFPIPFYNISWSPIHILKYTSIYIMRAVYYNFFLNIESSKMAFKYAISKAIWIVNINCTRQNTIRWEFKKSQSRNLLCY